MRRVYFVCLLFLGIFRLRLSHDKSVQLAAVVADGQWAVAVECVVAVVVAVGVAAVGVAAVGVAVVETAVVGWLRGFSFSSFFSSFFAQSTLGEEGEEAGIEEEEDEEDAEELGRTVGDVQSPAGPLHVVAEVVLFPADFHRAEV